ncbi:hypothetical protein V501_01404 [Pseudogymnoascus sp. VKM F-4519 (FW-2642)]|nr:hypothetical protein V501_01404 [Pseudogymnoascus sp. VKM F-4519 (FW-2642)]
MLPRGCRSGAGQVSSPASRKPTSSPKPSLHPTSQRCQAIESLDSAGSSKYVRQIEVISAWASALLTLNIAAFCCSIRSDSRYSWTEKWAMRTVVSQLGRTSTSTSPGQTARISSSLGSLPLGFSRGLSPSSTAFASMSLMAFDPPKPS